MNLEWNMNSEYKISYGVEVRDDTIVITDQRITNITIRDWNLMIDFDEWKPINKKFKIPAGVGVFYIYGFKLNFDLNNFFPNILKGINLNHHRYLESLPDKLPTQLRELQCGDIGLNELPRELPKNLVKLCCWENNIVKLPKLPNRLKILECFDNQLVKLPEMPDSIVKISCMDNRISRIDKIPNGIQELFIWDNELRNIPTLDSINGRILRFSYNKITRIYERNCEKKMFIVVDNNQLTWVPEICRKGTNITRNPIQKDIGKKRFISTKKLMNKIKRNEQMKLWSIDLIQMYFQTK